MVRLRHHWTMLCSLLSLIKISALMLQTLLAFPHTVFSINISVLWHMCIRVPRSQHCCTKCPPGCELWQSSSLRDLSEFLLKGRNAEFSAFMRQHLCKLLMTGSRAGMGMARTSLQNASSLPGTLCTGRTGGHQVSPRASWAQYLSFNGLTLLSLHSWHCWWAGLPQDSLFRSAVPAKG